ncbi:hypothetical protein [Cryobacterium sp. PH31-L1]|uniref:hypothetical protein n=1 Tax=Cryobacterium sp. PH31-L1 TaxID=3046199 RepID=UPI0024B8D4BB|nr:hypothetical protein [Cryobacterium sp. PH31-L1]MDJ0378601.1 hypothetical protein [Cryobacterium sp. PH31-L1]
MEWLDEVTNTTTIGHRTCRSGVETERPAASIMVLPLTSMHTYVWISQVAPGVALDD